MRFGKFAGLLIDHILCVITGNRNGNAVGSNEVPAILEVFLNTKTALMDQCVVLRAQQYQVVERCLAAIRPMLDMVAV